MRALPVKAFPVMVFPVEKISSEHFKLSAPINLPSRDTAEILRTLENAHSDLQRRLQPTSITNSTNVIVHNSTGDFVAATGQPAWAAGATQGDTIHLQPIMTLRKKGILTTTLRHEFAHAAMEAFTKKQIPRWLLEGLAIHFAGEGKFYPPSKIKPTVEAAEKKLSAAKTPAEMKTAYAFAYQLVQEFIVREKGEANVWKLALIR